MLGASRTTHLCYAEGGALFQIGRQTTPWTAEVATPSAEPGVRPTGGRAMGWRRLHLSVHRETTFKLFPGPFPGVTDGYAVS